jgi:hypothetical protein
MEQNKSKRRIKIYNHDFKWELKCNGSSRRCTQLDGLSYTSDDCVKINAVYIMVI